MFIQTLSGELIAAEVGMIVKQGHIREATIVSITHSRIKIRDGNLVRSVDSLIASEIIYIGQRAEDFRVHNYEYCFGCEELHDVDSLTSVNGEFFCEECRDEMCIRCSSCDEWTLSQDAFNYGSNDYCQYCFDREFSNCCNCGEIVHNNYMRTTCGDDYCESCWDDIFTYCEGCDEVIRRDEANYSNSDRCLCNCCFDSEEEEEEEERPESGIYGYVYKPKPIFHGGTGAEHEMFCGMELEVTVSRNIRNTAQDIRDEYEENYYLKEDGSIGGGFEIVTHPRTFKSWKEYWETFDAEVLRKLRVLGCSAHNSNCCGIHIHTSLDAWEGEQLFKLFSLLYDKNNYRHILTISQRRQEKLDSWASLRMADVGSRKEEIVKKKCCLGHHAALNITKDTLEIRIFNSNLRIGRVKKNMEFVYALYMYTQKATRVSWRGLVRWVTKNKKEVPNLFAFMKEKNMFMPAQKRTVQAMNVNTGEITSREIDSRVTVLYEEEEDESEAA